MIKSFIKVLAFLVTLPFAQESQNVAVMEFSGNNVPEGDLGGLSNKLRNELFNTGKFQVIERTRMNDILKEQGFQKTGCTSDECAVEIGQLIGVDKIVLGSVDKVGTIYSVNVRIVNVQNGKVEKTETEDCEDCSINQVFKNTIKSVSVKLAGISTNVRTVKQNKTPVKTETIPKMVSLPKIEVKIENGMVEFPEMDVQYKLYIGIFKTEIKTAHLQPYQIDQYEITVASYMECVRSGKCTPPEKTDVLANPVTSVSWNDAKTYCTFIGKRLPTKEEWMGAARGNTLQDYPWEGSNITSDMSNIINNYPGKPAQGGFFKDDKSAYGVYDLLGNVSEWVDDISGDKVNAIGYSFKYKNDGENNTAFLNSVKLMRAFKRNAKEKDIGFRCAQSVKK